MAGVCIVIIAVGLALGTIANLISPRRIPWMEDWGHFVEARAYRAGVGIIQTREAYEFFQKGTHLFLDARSLADYEQAHIPGALSVPSAAITEHLPSWQPLLSPNQPLVAYCAGIECDEALLLAIELKRLGITNVVLFVGGITQWRKSGFPIEGRL